MVSESKYFRADYERWDRERELRGGATQAGADMLVFSAAPAWVSGCGGPPKYEYCGQCGGVTQDQRCTVCGGPVTSIPVEEKIRLALTIDWYMFALP